MITVALSQLPAGVYTVAWQALAGDGHLTKGNYSFTLAATGPPAPTEPQSCRCAGSGAQSASSATMGNPTVLAVLVHWARYAALGLLVGAFALVTLVVRPAIIAREDSDALWRRTVRLVAPVALWGGVAFLIAHVLTLLVQAATLTDAGFAGARWATVRRVLVDTEYGQVWRFTTISAIAALMVMILGFPSAQRGGDRATLGIIATARRPTTASSEADNPAPAFWPWPVGLAISLVLVATLTLTSHAVESQHQPLLALIADGVHLGAMGVWFGGLLVLLLSMPRLDARPPCCGGQRAPGGADRPLLTRRAVEHHRAPRDRHLRHDAASRRARRSRRAVTGARCCSSTR